MESFYFMITLVQNTEVHLFLSVFCFGSYVNIIINFYLCWFCRNISGRRRNEKYSDERDEMKNNSHLSSFITVPLPNAIFHLSSFAKKGLKKVMKNIFLYAHEISVYYFVRSLTIA